jgi:hypothetical protein
VRVRMGTCVSTTPARCAAKAVNEAYMGSECKRIEMGFDLVKSRDPWPGFYDDVFTVSPFSIRFESSRLTHQL